MGLAGLILAGIVGCIELFMIGVYLKIANVDLNWMIEDDNIKYRTLIDRIPNSTKLFNKLYNCLFLIAKVLIVVAFIMENVTMIKIVITAFPVLLLIYDILHFIAAKV